MSNTSIEKKSNHHFKTSPSIKLIELYCMTKSDFWFSIAWWSKSKNNFRGARSGFSPARVLQIPPYRCTNMVSKFSNFFWRLNNGRTSTRVLSNDNISLKKIDWDQICCQYFIISRYTSMEPIIKCDSLLFILSSSLSLNFTVLEYTIFYLYYWTTAVLSLESTAV